MFGFELLNTTFGKKIMLGEQEWTVVIGDIKPASRGEGGVIFHLAVRSKDGNATLPCVVELICEKEELPDDGKDVQTG